MQNKIEFNEKLLEEIEQHLRLGERIFAREKLDQILNSHVKLSRISLVVMAELLRRAGYAHKSIKLLFRFVRGKGRNFKQASIQEKEEYAAALIALKAIEEAIILLSELKKENSPKTFLFLGMAHINRWDYENAIIELRKFQEFRYISNYDRYIGIINLMAALVTTAGTDIKKIGAIEEEIDFHLEATNELNFKILHANLLEIKSQLIVKSIQTKTSKALLKRASIIIKDPNSKDNLFVRKWEIIARKPDVLDDASVISKWKKEMGELRQKAKAINHIETIRDIDFHLGEFNPSLIQRVFFGTPYNTFREKIIEVYNPKLRSEYWLHIDSNSEAKKTEFDYLQYKDLKIGSIVLKVLKALTFDFYKRQTKYTLFELVFPNDYLDPSSSFNKIHQALSRTRQWLKKHKVPLEIHEENEEYFLVGNASIKIYLSDRIKELKKNKDESFYHELETLKDHYKKAWFNVNEAMVILDHSNLRKTQRLLKKALELGELAKEGSGKKTIYSAYIDSSMDSLSKKLN